MATVLVDTNVVSFLFRGAEQARELLPLLSGHDRAVSFQTVAELYEWSTSARWGARRTQRLADVLTAYYIVIPSDDELCREWSKVRAERYQAGRAISVADAWIAATARLYGLPLATYDSDFLNTNGVEILAQTGGSK